MGIDERFMLRALQLAAFGHGNVSPNPMVGCVIVHKNRIIGEGFHQQYGQAHAEVNAVRAVKDQSLLKSSTAYVTLEPCSHFGKTPPCADLLIHHQIKQVVICNLDPNPLVAGQGMLKLQNAGIEVITGVLSGKGRVLNRRFFMMIEHQRPFIILKYAQSADGYIAGENFKQIQISNQFSKRMVHQYRASEDAIMVGFNTALHDNPSLTTREWKGKNPLRVIIDKNLELAQSHQIYNSEAKTIIFNKIKKEELSATTSLQLVDYQQAIIPQILKHLYDNKIQSLIVEGGSKLLQSFIDAELYDEIRIFESKKILRNGINSPILPSDLRFKKTQIAGDSLKIFIKDY